jgi:hypothetical protein
MFYAFEEDIALWIFENRTDRILPVGDFGAIHRATRKQGGQLRDGQAEQLILKDMVESLLPVGNLFLQSRVEAFSDLTQEHARLAARVKEPRILVTPDLFRKHIQYLIHELRRRKHLVTAQIRDAGQYVRVMVSASQH